MSKAKVNYTEEQTAKMVADYTGVIGESQEVRDEMVESIAAEFGKSVRSIRAKLSREGVYVAKETKSKVTGEKPQTKEELAARLVTASGLPLVSAEKLNKTDLVKLISAFEGEDSGD